MSVDVYDLLIRSKFIQPSYIIEHSYVINWAAAWLDSEWNIKGGIKSDCVTQAESKRRNDKRIIKGIWELMDEADYICGHNSDNFDIKKLNWRYLVHGLNFPAQYKTLDTFKWAGRYTKPPSKGLEPLSVMLGYEPKDGLTADEWREIVHQGTPRLLNKSDRYCRGDVRNGVAVLGRYARAIEASGKELVKW
jgi:DNA polymerase elongation subunit (family B)